MTVNKQNLYIVSDSISGRDITQYSQQESHQFDSTSLRQTGVGHSSREKEHGQDMLEDKHDQMGLTAEQDARELKSQYQKDFPPPSSFRRRRTPALPQPDNIGINPAFRWEGVCQLYINVTNANSSHVCVLVTGLNSVQFKERLTLVGPSWILGTQVAESDLPSMTSE